MTEKIKATEIVGELRKAARLYEVFKQAADSAGVLAGMEQETASLERERDKLRAECLDLDSKCDLAVAQANKAVQEAEEAKHIKARILKEAETQAMTISTKAKSDAEALVKASMDIVESMQSQIDGLKGELHTLGVRKAEALRDYEKAEKKVKDFKDKFLATI